MTHPDAIAFLGRIDLLEEKAERTAEEIDLDDLPEDKIVYPDLVFTLKKDPAQYYRPGVRRQDGKLEVVTNPLFFRAARDAGIEPIRFDLIPPEGERPQLDEQWLKKLGIRDVPEPEMNFCKRIFFFFNRKPVPFISLEGLYTVTPSKNNQSPEYQEAGCLEYTTPIGTESHGRELVRRLHEINGPLRSINGIKDLGPHRDYFS